MKKFLSTALAFAALCEVASAEPIYLANRLYTGHVRTGANGVTLVQLKEFVKAAGIYPGAVVVTPPYHGSVKVTYRGHTFTLPVDENTVDSVYVPARTLVEGLGGRWNANATLGVTDVYMPAAPRVAVKDDPHTVLLQSTEAHVPLRIDSFTYYDPTLPGNFSNVQVRGTMVVQNTGDSFVDNVDLVVHIQDGYGADLSTVQKHAGRIEPNQEVRWEWEWNNAALNTIHPLAEAVSDPYLTRAERKAGKKTSGPRVSINSKPTAGDPASGPTLHDTGTPPATSTPATAPGFDPTVDPGTPPRPPGY